MNSNIAELIRTCREQTELYLKRESYSERACFDLWQLAVVKHDQDAWNALHEQYQSFVRRWLQQRLASSPSLQAEEDALLNGVFINVYRFLNPEKFNSFNNLPSIMQYLKMCCWTVVADAQRDLQARKPEISLESAPGGDDPDGTGELGLSLIEQISDPSQPEEEVLGKLDRDEFWQTVWSKLEAENDRLLVYSRYILNLPPREITLLYPDQFPTVQEVYRRLKNLLWRLRNSRFF